ncbi:hypothetical protein JCM17380_10350 [Desulfosporosinus burensis]
MGIKKSYITGHGHPVILSRIKPDVKERENESQRGSYKDCLLMINRSGFALIGKGLQKHIYLESFSEIGKRK